MKKNAQITDYRLQAHSSVCNQNGAALLITLLIVSILTGLAVDFAYEVYIGTSSLSNWSNAQKASLAAKSGQSLASNLLKEIKDLPPTSQSEALLPIEKSFGENTILTVKLEDEEAKFNVNSILYPDGTRIDEIALASLINLFKYLNINPDIAQYIADWIDPDNTPRLGGSEDNAKNAVLWSLEELNFIKGIDKETFDKISPYLTIYGYKKININTAKLPVLVSLSGIEEPIAKLIIYYRESAPFKNTESMVNISDLKSIGTTLQGKIIFKSSNFRVTATATVDEITRIIESVTDTSMNIHYWRES
jgi:general secretion pathway protein K